MPYSGYSNPINSVDFKRLRPRNQAAIVAAQIPITGGTILTTPYEKPVSMFIAAPVVEALATFCAGPLSIEVK
jgi:hypothetical protein